MSLLVRSRVIWEQLRKRPGCLEPEEALAAVVWPSDEFVSRFPAEPLCAGCGVVHSDETEGCRHCYQRHYARNVREDSPTIHKLCRGCGCDFNERTRGCKRCSDRMRSRRRRADERVR